MRRSGNIAASFQCTIRAQQERIWNLQTQRTSLEIDGQLELRGLLNGYVFRLPPL